MSDDKSSMIKLLFELEQDEDDYPPFRVESLWATPLGRSNYRLENTPFFAYDAALGDVFLGQKKEGEIWATRRLERSGNRTLRLLFWDLRIRSRLLRQLASLGCFYEGTHLKRLVAINIHQDIDLKEFISLITPLRNAEKIGTDEGEISAPDLGLFE